MTDDVQAVHQPSDLRTVIMTGASSGIGAKAAATLAEGGAHVVVVGRNTARTKEVASRIGGTAHVADFDRLDEVRDLAQRLLDENPRIDVLANNAGGLVSHRSETTDGFERTLQSNHLAPFLLTRLLLPRIVESAGRVVSTSSTANLFGRVRLDDLNWRKRPWAGGWLAYGTSKLLTNMFISQLAARSPIQAYAFHPGFVSTSFGSDSASMRVLNTLTGGSYGISADAGAVPLATLSGPTTVGVPSGTYFDQLKPYGRQAPQAKDRILAEVVWETSSRLVSIPSDL
ncbi:SDR family NAD(P)-dependent oxidoreductase [Frondihabitans australicus]|uniref:NAD(P)-dependent dehydrogenase (Short-subunit alcohol dehydrogenase family) n=1 Tax=Frondihabitans australicus TaxID=386892 RepID=A0A495IFE8_9MICO|nr:SDR family NAD(P)-dependent oxidoreductase [Frondihabitans australicus]RKR73776.1 NAD(P)-dependent dehydrogenase (short-subunit alcohol dehydrogenase family) [Frondihabitans australicus]